MIPISSAGEPAVTTRSGIEYWEMPNNGEAYAQNASFVTRQLGVRWRESIQFVNDILGDAVVVGDKLRRDLPERHPELDAYPMEGRLVSVAGWPSQSSAKVITWNNSSPEYGVDKKAAREENGDGLAIYEFTYRPQLMDYLTDAEADARAEKELSRYVILNTEPMIDSLPIPPRALYWEATPEIPLNAAAPIMFPKRLFSLRWTMVPLDGIPTATIDATEGKVNLNEFSIPIPKTTKKFVCAAETLLCFPPKISIYAGANLKPYADIEYLFEYRKTTHNKFLFWNLSVPEFRKVLWGTASRGVFETADFAQLFNVGAG